MESKYKFNADDYPQWFLITAAMLLVLCWVFSLGAWPLEVNWVKGGRKTYGGWINRLLKKK